MSKPGASTEEPNQNQRDEFAAAIESKDLNLVTNRGVTRLRSCASCLYVASPPNRQTKWQSNSLTIRSVTFETKLNFELGLEQGRIAGFFECNSSKRCWARRLRK